MMEISYNQIGVIHTPYKTAENIPIQNVGAKDIRGTIEINQEFESGLKDLDGFSHLILIYHFHEVKHFSLQVIPFLDNQEHGIFATRSPVRPNPIGLTVVKLIDVNKNIITIEGIDVIDKTPLLDIKPYIPMVDDISVFQLGWMEDKCDDFLTVKSDNRFINK